MRGIFEVVCVARGTHGPFKPTADEVAEAKAAAGRDLTPAELAGLERSYEYVTLAAVDGSGSSNATYAPDLVFEPELFKPYRLVIEVRAGGKLRLHGEAPAVLAEARPKAA